MTFSGKRLLFLLLFAASILAVAAPAEANVGFRYRDHVRDAPAAIDMTLVDGHYNANTVTIRILVRNLKKTGQFTVGSGVAGWGYNFIVTKGKHRILTRVHGYSEVNDLGSWNCRGARVNWNAKRNVIIAQFPTACTGSRAFRDDDVVVNGVDFRRGRELDRVGNVFYRP